MRRLVHSSWNGGGAALASPPPPPEGVGGVTLSPENGETVTHRSHDIGIDRLVHTAFSLSHTTIV